MLRIFFRLFIVVKMAHRGGYPRQSLTLTRTQWTFQLPPCMGVNSTILGVRYAWRKSPCSFQRCALYQGMLPVPPFQYYGQLHISNHKIQRNWHFMNYHIKCYYHGLITRLSIILHNVLILSVTWEFSIKKEPTWRLINVLRMKAKSRKYRGIFEEHSAVK